ncbi:MAG TPA: YceI family protein [Thermoanaerobaculia bacterium]
MTFPLLAVLLTVATAAQAAAWSVTGSSVTFAVRNAGAVVDGKLGNLTADIAFDPAALEASSIRATVDTASVRTGIALRDRHLRSCDYFCAGQHPKILMESRGFEALGGDRYRGAFDLTIRGTKQRVEVPFTFRSDGATGRFSGEITIDRTHFGVGGKSMFVASDVAVRVDVNVKREAE